MQGSSGRRRLLGGNAGEFPSGLIVHVRDEAGAAVAGATVEVYPVFWYSQYVPNTSIRSGTTDAAGDWMVGGDVFSLEIANLHVVATEGTRTWIGWVPYVDAQGQYFTSPGTPFELTLEARGE